MDQRGFLAGALAAVAAPLPSRAEPPAQIARVGMLAGVAGSRIEAFRQGMRDLGYVEGKTLAIETRFGPEDQLPALAGDLIRLNVHVLVTDGVPATRAAQQATRTIPIVMATTADPVGSGFVASLGRPGGNITGLADIFSELNGKRLEILKTAVPGATRVAILGNPTHPLHRDMLRDLEATARTLGVQLQVFKVRHESEIDHAFTAMARERVSAVLVLPHPVFFPGRAQIANLAVKSRLPSAVVSGEYVEAGGLLAYGPNKNDLARRAATYVDKILKGAKPADLPVQQPTKFELVINMKTAKALGLTIPQSVLL